MLFLATRAPYSTATYIILVVLGLLVAIGPALAQEEGQDLPEEAAKSQPEAEVASGAEPVVEGEENSGWFRIDTDSLQTQFWFGASHHIGGLEIASDIYVVGSFAELDVGPTFSVGNLAITPMVGMGVDFSEGGGATLVAPQLFTILDASRFYLESWVQFFVSSPFADGAEDFGYTRDFALYKLSDAIHLGPQVEMSYRLRGGFDDTTMSEAPRGLTSMPLGGRVNLSYGAKNTLGIFLARETRPAADGRRVSGRFTFVRNW